MKKIILIMLLAIIGISSKTMGQGTCQNATLLTPNDTIIQLSANDSVAWFMYQAGTSYLRLSLLSSDLLDAPLSIANYSDIKVFTGICSGLTELTDYDSLTSFIYSNNNLNFPGTYYIKVMYKGEWDASLKIEKVLFPLPVPVANCQYNCNLISNGDFSITTATYNENYPFFYSKVYCWCAAWGSPFIQKFYTGLPTPLTNNSLGLGCGYQGTNYPYNFNGSEAVYQNINIESNKTYKLSFKYKQFAPFSDVYGGKLHVLITSDNFGCLGNVDNIQIPGFAPKPNINNVVWEYSTIVKRYIDLSHYKLFDQDITMPVLSPNLQYKLLFYLEFVDSSPYTRYVLIDDISLSPTQQTPVSITPSVNGSICQGSSITLTGNVQSNFPYFASWDNGVVSFSTNNQITVQPSVTTTYTFSVIDVNGCTNTAQYTVVVLPIPVPVINANFGNNVCEGQTVTYTTQAGNTNYIWNYSAGGSLISGGGANQNYISIKWNTPGSQSVNVKFTSNGCISNTTTYNLTVHPKPVVNLGADRQICNGDVINLGQYLLINGSAPTANYTYNWFGMPSTAINTASPASVINPTAAPAVNTTFHLTVTSPYGCSSSDEFAVTVVNVEKPVIIGAINNCDLTTTYTASNGANYTWAVAANNIGFQTGSGSSITVTWPSPINNSTPGVVILTSTSSTAHCSAQSTLYVYECCKTITDRNIYNRPITAADLPFSSGEVVYINGIVDLETNLDLNNVTLKMGPYSKITLNPDIILNVDNQSAIQAGCEFMYDGIYVNDVTSAINVTTNSTVRDAINGLVSDNGAVITLNEANMLNNFYSLRINNTNPAGIIPPPGQAYPPYAGSIKKTSFSCLPYLQEPYTGLKSLIGIDCYNANNVTIGDESDANLRNTFNNLRFGIYAYNSDLNIVNNSFNNIENAGNLPVFPVNNYSPFTKYYEEGAIYAVHKPVYDERPDNYLNVGGDIQMPLKRNYFENCKTGIYSFKCVNDLENNDFKDCYNGISLVNISSGGLIMENEFYGSQASLITFGKAISVRNALPDANGTSCLIQSNSIKNKQTGISVVNVKSTPEYQVDVLNNSILNFAPVFPTSANVSSGAYVPANFIQTAIMAEGCDGIQIKENTINHNYPVIAAEKENIRGIRVSESKDAYVFHNYLTHMGSGIYTNGLLTNTRFDCNILDHDWYGFYFGMFSLISNQGSNMFNPHNNWQGNYIIGQEKLYSPLGYMINGTVCNNPPYNGSLVPLAKWYYYDNAGMQYSTMPNSTIGVDYIVNNNATHYCVSGGSLTPLPDPNEPIESWEDREEAMGEIVRDERLYAYMEDYYRARDREYVYEILRENPALLYMGTADDNLYQQFYAEMHYSEAEQVLQLREAMFDEDLAVALSKLEQIAGENVANENRNEVNRIYINTWAQNQFQFTSEQYAALNQLAYLTPYSGGDAVYTARVMLNIDPDDAGLDFVKPIAPQSEASNEITAKVFPNPAKDKLTIQFTDVLEADALLSIYNNMGSLVYSDYISMGNYEKTLDISKLKSGLYFYNVSINANKITSGKITILNK